MNRNQEPGKPWLALTVALMTFSLAGFLRHLWPSMLPAVMPVLNIGFTEAMSFTTALFLGSLVARIPGGLLSDRLGPGPIIIAGLIIAGLSAIGLGAVNSFGPAFIWQIICGLGLGLGLLFPACFKIVFVSFEPFKRQVFIFVLWSFPYTFGVALSNSLVGDLSETLGWRNIYRLAGLSALIMGTLTLALTRGVGTFKDGMDQTAGLRKNSSDRRTLGLIMIAVTLLCLCGHGFQASMRGFLTEGGAGFNRMEAGRVMMAWSLAGFISSLFTLYLVYKKPGQIKKLLLIACPGLAAGLLSFGQMAGIYSLQAAAILGGLFYGAADLLLLLLTIEKAPPSRAGAVAGLYSFLLAIGSFAGRPLAAAVVNFSSGLLCPYLALTALAAAFCVFSIGRPEDAR